MILAFWLHSLQNSVLEFNFWWLLQAKLLGFSAAFFLTCNGENSSTGFFLLNSKPVKTHFLSFFFCDSCTHVQPTWIEEGFWMNARYDDMTWCVSASNGENLWWFLKKLQAPLNIAVFIIHHDSDVDKVFWENKWVTLVGIYSTHCLAQSLWIPDHHTYAWDFIKQLEEHNRSKPVPASVVHNLWSWYVKAGLEEIEYPELTSTLLNTYRINWNPRSLVPSLNNSLGEWTQIID